VYPSVSCSQSTPILPPVCHVNVMRRQERGETNETTKN
jgi:hypothetical protein